jgi:phospholipid/cholesterol/gamma-HCH transport system substrate-binding protein
MSSTVRLGLFIVFALVILASAIFLIGDKQFLFQNKYRLNAEFPTVIGLTEGGGVRVAGIHKGTVRQIDLPGSPEGKVRVQMDLDNATLAVIKKDSKASITSEGLVGDKYVEITIGSAAAEPVKEGDTIEGQPALQIGDVMKKANQVLETANVALAGVGQAVGSLQSITGKIDRGTGTVGALVNDRTLFNRVNAGALAFQEDMEALKHNFLVRGFFKKRGYDDSTELTKYVIAKLPRQEYSRKFAWLSEKIFDKPDTAKIKNHKALDEAGRYLESNPYSLVVVQAYTGMKGDSEDNRVLTQAQSMVVRNYLAENFRLDDTRIRTHPLGKTARIAEGSQVEVLVYGNSPAAGNYRAGQKSHSVGGPKWQAAN